MGPTSTAVNWIHLEPIAAAIRGPAVTTTLHPIELNAKAAIIVNLIDFLPALVDESGALLPLESFTWHLACGRATLRKVKNYLFGSNRPKMSPVAMTSPSLASHSHRRQRYLERRRRAQRRTSYLFLCRPALGRWWDQRGVSAVAIGNTIGEVKKKGRRDDKVESEKKKTEKKARHLFPGKSIVGGTTR